MFFQNLSSAAFGMEEFFNPHTTNLQQTIYKGKYNYCLVLKTFLQMEKLLFMSIVVHLPQCFQKSSAAEVSDTVCTRESVQVAQQNLPLAIDNGRSRCTRE